MKKKVAKVDIQADEIHWELAKTKRENAEIEGQVKNVVCDHYFGILDKAEKKYAREEQVLRRWLGRSSQGGRIDRSYELGRKFHGLKMTS